jgi:seryl-tRNA synthetase
LIDENSIKDFINYFKSDKEEITNKETFESSYSHIRNKISKIKEILKDNNDFLSLVSKLEELDKRNDKLSEDFQKEHQNLIKELANYLSRDNNTTKIFQKLQDDPESYEALYKFLQNLENPQIVNILQNIPQNPKDLQL